MHSEINLTPQNMHASHIREKISEKVASTLKATASEEQVDYIDIIYLINGKKIQQNVIRAFLSEMYRTELQEINNHWKQKLSQEKILEDVYAIKRKTVQQQWTQVNINHKNIKQKQQRYKKYGSSFKNRKQLNSRIKEISDNIKILENNINMCKKQTQQLKLRQQYKQMRQQLRFLTNKSRKLKHLSQQKMINNSLTKSQQKLKDIYERIEEINIEEKRLKQIQHLKFNKKQSTKSSEASPRKSKHRLKKLQQIFMEFSRKEVKQFMLFDEIMRTHKYMSLENFLRFVACSGIGSQLNLDEKVNIFKMVSQFHSRISFLDFMQVLKEICIKQCEKLNVKFHASILDTFLEQMAVCLQNSSRKIQDPLLSNSNDFIKKLRGQVFSNYQFKIKSHTGKQKNDIKEYLIQKKKFNKTQPSINMNSKKSNVTLEKIPESGPLISRKGERTQTYKTDNKFVKRKLTSNYKTVNVNHNQAVSQTTSFKSSFEKDTYSNIFLKKRSQLKSQKKEQKVNDDEAQSKGYIEDPNINMHQVKNQIFINLTPATYDHTIQKHELERDQLKDIVELDQDDPFLTNHLSLNYSIKANKAPSQQSKYHF